LLNVHGKNGFQRLFQIINVHLGHERISGTC
jgi:hypothetical protein